LKGTIYYETSSVDLSPGPLPLQGRGRGLGGRANFNQLKHTQKIRITIGKIDLICGMGFPFRQSNKQTEMAMSETHTKGETHGCIVCGKLYQLYVVYDASGKFVDSKVMSAGGRRVDYPGRALVACESHSEAEIQAAILRVYGDEAEDKEEE